MAKVITAEEAALLAQGGRYRSNGPVQPFRLARGGGGCHSRPVRQDRAAQRYHIPARRRQRRLGEPGRRDPGRRRL